MDWGAGEYERTARELEPAAQAAIDALHPHHGDRVLDVACGTGNAALLAAQRGAQIFAVDASARLIEVAAQRVHTEALEGDWRVADMQDLPYQDDYFDGVISVFGVIFAEDPIQAANELKRVAKPGATIVITTWLPRGPIADLMKHVRSTVVEFVPPQNEAPAHLDWSGVDNLRDHFGPETEVTNHEIEFTASSAGAWIIEQSEFHPAWLELRELLPPERYEQLLDELTQMFTRANTDPDALRVVGEYVIARARV